MRDMTSAIFRVLETKPPPAESTTRPDLAPEVLVCFVMLI